MRIQTDVYIPPMWHSSLILVYQSQRLQLKYEAGVLEGHCPAEFSSKSNPDQTHLSKLIKVFRITRNSQVGVFDQGWS